ncbi:hypothetical protein [Nocardia brevicatena]|uniref:hypothetical protein n=1 Tax=Nocardia brevicatena TaxID=37327 RepID=UPI00146144EF|nr:hypothetical protein [Nocardia brevicatena]
MLDGVEIGMHGVETIGGCAEFGFGHRLMFVPVDLGEPVGDIDAVTVGCAAHLLEPLIGVVRRDAVDHPLRLRCLGEGLGIALSKAVGDVRGKPSRVNSARRSSRVSR